MDELIYRDYLMSDIALSLIFNLIVHFGHEAQLSLHTVW